MIAGILYGISVGITSPTLFAWAIDLCPENVRGRSISTIFIALEAGIMVGSLATNYLYANNIANLPTVYSAAAFCGFLAWLYLLFGVRTKR
jgi:MFS family permease